MKEFIVTEQELIQSFKLNFKHNIITKKWKFIIAEVAIVIVAIALSYVPNMSILPSLILIFFIPMIWLIVWLNLSPELKRQYKNNPYLSKPKTVSWDNEFLYTQTQYLESKVPWQHFLKVIENDNLILLYELPNQFTLYPKRVFDSHHEISEFIALAKQGIDNKENSTK